MTLNVVIRAEYDREIPSLIDGDGSVLAVHVVPVTEYIKGTISEVTRRYEFIRAEHPGARFASVTCIYCQEEVENG